MKKINTRFLKYGILSLIILATLLLSTVTAHAAFYGDTTGGAGGGSTATTNGYSLMYLEKAIGYRFSYISADKKKLGTPFNVICDGYGQYMSSKYYTFTNNRCKSDWVAVGTTYSIGSGTNKSSYHNESTMGFNSGLPTSTSNLASNLAAWEANKTNLNAVVAKWNISSYKKMIHESKIVVEPLFLVQFGPGGIDGNADGNPYYIVTVSDIAAYGALKFGGSTVPARGSNESSWEYIARFTNIEYPNSLYTKSGNTFNLWPAATSLTSCASFNTIMKKGYGVGVMYNATDTLYYYVAYNSSAGVLTPDMTHSYDASKVTTTSSDNYQFQNGVKYYWGTKYNILASRYSYKGHTQKGWYAYQNSTKTFLTIDSSGNASGWKTKEEIDNSSGKYKMRVLSLTGTFKDMSSTNGDYIIMYAVWEPNHYYVKYNSGANTLVGITHTYPENKVTVTSSDNYLYADGVPHTYGVAEQLQASRFKRDGYVQTGWRLTRKLNTDTIQYYGRKKNTDDSYAWIPKEQWDNTYEFKEMPFNATFAKWAAVNGAVCTLYANWRPVQYNVKYNSNTEDASGVSHNYTSGTITKNSYGLLYDPPQIVKYNQESTTFKPNKFKYVGHTFTGWKALRFNKQAEKLYYGKNSEGVAGWYKNPTTYYIYKDNQAFKNFIKDSLDDNCTIFMMAQWRPNELNICYNVDRDVVCDGGANQYYISNNDGYIRSNATSTSNAWWTNTQKLFYQTFFYNVEYDGGLLNRSTLGITKKGYKFGYYDSDGKKLGDWKINGKYLGENEAFKPTDISTNINNGDVTLCAYGNWKPIEYKIKYNSNTGTASDVSHSYPEGTVSSNSYGLLFSPNPKQIVRYNETGTLMNNKFTYVGHTFTGWRALKFKTVDGVTTTLYYGKAATTDTSYGWYAKPAAYYLFADGKSFKNLVSDLSDDDCIIYMMAQWIPNKYNIRYVSNLGDKAGVQYRSPILSVAEFPNDIVHIVQSSGKEVYYKYGNNVSLEKFYISGSPVFSKSGSHVHFAGHWYASKFVNGVKYYYAQSTTSLNMHWVRADKVASTEDIIAVKFNDGVSLSDKFKNEINDKDIIYFEAQWTQNCYHIKYTSGTQKDTINEISHSYNSTKITKTEKDYVYNPGVTIVYNRACNLELNKFTRERYTFKNWTAVRYPKGDTSQPPITIGTYTDGQKNIPYLGDPETNNDTVYMIARWTPSVETRELIIHYNAGAEGIIPSGSDYYLNNKDVFVTASNEQFVQKATKEDIGNDNVNLKGHIEFDMTASNSAFTGWKAYDENTNKWYGKANATDEFYGWCESPEVYYLFSDNEKIDVVNLCPNISGTNAVDYTLKFVAQWSLSHTLTIRYRVKNFVTNGIYKTNTNGNILKPGSGAIYTQTVKYTKSASVKLNTLNDFSVTPNVGFKGAESNWSAAGDVREGFSSLQQGRTIALSVLSPDIVNKDCTITLTISAVPIKYNVCYDGNDETSGSENMTNQSFVFDANNSITQNLRENAFVKTGYDFAKWMAYRNSDETFYGYNSSNVLGWYTIDNIDTSKGTNGYYLFDSKEEINNLTNVDDDLITMKTQWTYTVSYDPNGGVGEILPSATINKNDSNTAVEKCYYGNSYFLKNSNGFTRDGYGFIEWNTERDGSGVSYDDLAEIKDISDGATSNVVLYAQWGSIKYKVYYMSNGATSETYSSHVNDFAEGSSATLLKFMDERTWYYGVSDTLTKNEFAKRGYTFTYWFAMKLEDGKTPYYYGYNESNVAGWYKDSELDATRDFGGKMPFADEADFVNIPVKNDEIIYMYAQWRPNVLTVLYNINGVDIPSGTYIINDDNYVCYRDTDEYYSQSYKYDGVSQCLTSADSFGTDLDGTSIKKWYNETTKTEHSIVELLSAITLCPDIVNGDQTITVTAIVDKNALRVYYNGNGCNITDGSTYWITPNAEYKKTETYGGVIREKDDIFNKPVDSGDWYYQEWLYNKTKPNGLITSAEFGLYKEGFVFIGWCKDPNGTGVIYKEKDSSTLPQELYSELKNNDGAIKLYAIWTPTTNDINITFIEGQIITKEELKKSIEDCYHNPSIVSEITEINYPCVPNEEAFPNGDANKRDVPFMNIVDYNPEGIDAKYLERYTDNIKVGGFFTYLNEIPKNGSVTIPIKFKLLNDETEYSGSVIVKYNNPPQIVAEDRWFTLDEAKGGIITEENLMSGVNASDKEDSFDILNSIVMNPDFSIFEPHLKNSGNIDIEFSVVDNYGKNAIKPIAIHIASSKGFEKTRFISDNYYPYMAPDLFVDSDGSYKAKKYGGILYYLNTNKDFAVNEAGYKFAVDAGPEVKILLNADATYSIIPLSDWLKDQDFISSMKKCLSNKKDELGNWQYVEEIWHFDVDEIKNIRSNIINNGTDTNFYTNQCANGNCMFIASKSQTAEKGNSNIDQSKYLDIDSNGTVLGFNEELFNEWNSLYGGKLVIPSSKNGIEITAILAGAFASNEALKLVVIPSNVMVINQNAFSNCKNLTVVYMLGSTEQINVNDIESVVTNDEGVEETVITQIYGLYPGTFDENVKIIELI